MLYPPKRRGRPRLDPNGPPAAPIFLTVTAGDYDAVAKLAATRRESIQDVLRRGLRRELRLEHHQKPHM